MDFDPGQRARDAVRDWVLRIPHARQLAEDRQRACGARARRGRSCVAFDEEWDPDGAWRDFGD